MKNSSVVGIILIFIIGYAIMTIGIGAALIGLVAGIFYIIKTIRENRLRKINKKRFYDYLLQQYGITEDSTEDDKIDNKLKSALSHIMSKQYIQPNLEQGFCKFKSVYHKAVNSSSIWVNENLLQNNSCDSNTLSRHNLTFEEKGFLDIVGSSEHPFLLKAKNYRFYFYPNFVIKEVNCEYNIVEYNDISVKHVDSIYVTEQSGKTIKGASPAYYDYLHKRVDGGPDRRYKNNPSAPVYCHTICRLYVDHEIQIISASSNSVKLLERGIKQYKNDLNTQPIQIVKNIKEINFDSNEYATFNVSSE